MVRRRLKSLVDCLPANGTEVGSDFVRQHLLQPKTKEVWRVAAVGPCHNVTSETARASRPAMAPGAAINQPGADRQVSFDVSHAVAGEWSNSLQPRVLALKELTPAPDSSKGIAVDDEHGGVQSHNITATRPCLFKERLVDSDIRRVRRNCFIGQLCVTSRREVAQEAAQSAERRNDGSIAFETHIDPPLREGLRSVRRAKKVSGDKARNLLPENRALVS